MFVLTQLFVFALQTERRLPEEGRSERLRVGHRLRAMDALGTYRVCRFLCAALRRECANTHTPFDRT